jgi:SAM-dependent methyltransferase
MFKKTRSLIRLEEYTLLKKLEPVGELLDLGGSTKSGYHELLPGVVSITTVNINREYGCDLVFDIQKPFPLETDTFQTVLAINVLEHIFDFHAVVRETFRVLKPKGRFVVAVPFMFHIHGSPDDYFRYTESALRTLMSQYGFININVSFLGHGLFSLVFQTIGGVFPSFIQGFFGFFFSKIDSLLCVWKRYRLFAQKIPLGYFVVAQKPE